MNYFDRVKPTYIENWPAGLCSLSVAQVDVPLSREEAYTLGACNGEYGDSFPARPLANMLPLVGRLADGVDKFPDGAVVRLGSRSPKDSWTWYRDGPRVTTGTAAFQMLRDSSERVNDDLLLALKHDYLPHVFLRQYIDIPAWAEFRCFMRGRRWAGMSQYQHREQFPKVVEYADPILWAVRDRFFPQFRAESHLDDVVFDVFVSRRTHREEGGATETEWRVKLLEINPLFEMTDPCLFCWTGGGDFDGSFRFRNGAFQVQSITR